MAMPTTVHARLDSTYYFEECERTFAKSNHLASTTRLCTQFHRQQQIDEHFYFNDLDKHAASGRYQKYWQAVEKIAISTGQLSHLESTLKTTATDYENYHAAKVKYFQDLRKEPEEVQQIVEYIEKLQKYAEALYVCEAHLPIAVLNRLSEASKQAKAERNRLDYNIVHNGYTSRQITHVHTCHQTTYTRLLACEEDLLCYEEEHHIATRLKLATERKYRAALTEVERLVVQRLLELTKLGHEWACFAEVIQMTSLAEFDILRDMWQDIQLLLWTQSARCEAMVLHFGMKRAKEEIQRLNGDCGEPHNQPRLGNGATEVLTRFPCFSGTVFPGQHVDSNPDPSEGVPAPYWLASELWVIVMSVEVTEPSEDTHHMDRDEDDSELIVRELDVEEDGIVQLMDHLSTFDDS
ncbi:hypothetical protein C8R45DRAFT_935937 [Mycena sanguinolenta]|nr:hypothetical protein C8R45DRAFT_935937 [Mycena sanguinolenta]